MYDWANKIILIVEDNSLNYEFLQLCIKKTGAKCIHANNGKEAIDICQNNAEVGLVLMDIQMPLIDGYEATRIIKMLRPDLPIIAQTAYALDGDEEKALAAGCNDYITKPIVKRQLMETLQKYL